MKTGEIAKILREGYDVARLNDGFQQLIQQLRLDFLFIRHPPRRQRRNIVVQFAISDVLILLVRPITKIFQGTAVAVELARKLDVPELFVVLNKVPAGMDPTVLQVQVESMYSAEVLAVLP